MRRILPLLLALALLGACAARLPQTPSQGMVAAETAYQAGATAALSYLRQPDADPSVSATVRRLDRDAYAALIAARISSDAGRPGAETASLAATSALTSYLVRQGVP